MRARLAAGAEAGPADAATAQLPEALLAQGVTALQAWLASRPAGQ